MTATRSNYSLETGHSIGTVHQEGGLDGASWAVSCYAFHALGSSTETFHEENDRQALDYGTYVDSGSSLAYYHYNWSQSTMTDDWGRDAGFETVEEGTRGEDGTFTFTNYEEDDGSVLAGTMVVDTAWSHEEDITDLGSEVCLSNYHQESDAVGHRQKLYADEETAYHVGDGSIGEDGNFGYSLYSESVLRTENETYLETGTWFGSYMPPDYGSWVLSDSATLTQTRDTQGSGLGAVSTETVDSFHSLTEVRYGAFSAFTLHYEDGVTNTGSFACDLAPPEPSNLYAFNAGERYVAVAENLRNRGLARGGAIYGSGSVPTYGGGTNDYGSQNDSGGSKANDDKGGGQQQPGLGGAGGVGGGGAPGKSHVEVPNALQLDAEYMAAQRAWLEGLTQASNDACRRNGIDTVGWLNYQLHGANDGFHKLSDFFAGWGDKLSGGGTQRFRKWFGYDDAVNKDSKAYGLGTDVGWVHSTILKMAGGANFESLGSAAGLAEGIATGDPDAIFAAAEGLAAAKLQGMGGCGSKIVQGMQGLAAADTMADSYVAAQRGDYKTAAKLFADAALMMKQLRSCFAAGTKLWTRDGYKKIEDFRPGDQLLSRSEDDPSGPIEEKVVQAIFTRHALIVNLHVDGQVISTTGEHPFFLQGKGWTSTSELKAGDRLLTAGGQWAMVEEVYETGEFQTVYNLAVADFHTYFIGDDGWAFQVWAHNNDDVCFKYSEKKAKPDHAKNHLNQSGAYGKEKGVKGGIPRNDGLSHYLTDQQHKDFHRAMNEFWAPYRKGGALEGQDPTNAQYASALRSALKAAGVSGTLLGKLLEPVSKLP